MANGNVHVSLSMQNKALKGSCSFIITVEDIMFSVVLVCLSVRLSVNNIAQKVVIGLLDCNEILWRGPGWKKEHVIRVWSRSRSPW